MQISITSGAHSDTIVTTRDDGSIVTTQFPKKGPLPHDAIHVIVEDEVGLRHAFWGMVAAGKHPEDIQEIAKSAGHASASRASVPDPAIVELLQAERIVECVEAQAWSNAPIDPATFRSVAEAGCAASFVPAPPLPDATIQKLTTRVAALRTAWATGAVTFTWPAA